MLRSIPSNVGRSRISQSGRCGNEKTLVRTSRVCYSVPRRDGEGILSLPTLPAGGRKAGAGDKRFATRKSIRSTEIWTISFTRTIGCEGALMAHLSTGFRVRPSRASVENRSRGLLFVPGGFFFCVLGAKGCSICKNLSNQVVPVPSAEVFWRVRKTFVQTAALPSLLTVPVLGKSWNPLHCPVNQVHFRSLDAQLGANTGHVSSYPMCSVGALLQSVLPAMFLNLSVFFCCYWSSR